MAMAIAHAVRSELRLERDKSAAADPGKPTVQVTRYKDSKAGDDISHSVA